ncbi:NUDIX hydrolase [Sphingomonas sp. H39-1-10]|uniref:NUDIX domain-containing protein n=1 Tax=Sphingomonas TaxID=13687 RepID=UPI00087FC383|nr:MULTISPECIES: NUDIX hydrolase [Sphingomonas]MDF0489569.1 NUDIX hydrolase [Sphingomonas pollutisoli]SDA28517.1 8-oxo-dGTP pyrophosphatase MutT, NUDIX family [Sphingomonas sp. NFR15]
MFAIDSVRSIYQGWLNLVMVRLRTPDGVTFDRHVIELGKAVVVLPYNPATGMALTVSMPRAPVTLLGFPNMLEAIAGKLDSDDPEECARREAMEEAGVRLDALDHVGCIWPMPSNATERLDYFLAPYADTDRIASGGGLAEEHENITVHEIPLAELWARYEDSRLPDGKLVTLLLALRVRRPDLFA